MAINNKFKRFIRWKMLANGIADGTITKHSERDYSIKCAGCGEARHYTGDSAGMNIVVNFDHLCRSCSKLGEARKNL